MSNDKLSLFELEHLPESVRTVRSGGGKGKEVKAVDLYSALSR